MSLSTGSMLDAIAPELQEFERRLRDTVRADIGPMSEAMEHIVHAGGKRLRPALVILSGLLGEPDIDRLYNLAMGIEFIHTATLIHDDLIDDAETRRGLATIHAMLGSDPAIIVGDYYFAKGANLCSSTGLPKINSVVSAAVMTICMGELLQLTSQRDYDQPLESYYHKIERKTAALLAASSYSGAIIGNLDESRQQAMQRYGRYLGTAFQIADDVLDYVATADQLGKPVGADLRQGTITLPLMYALKDGKVGPALRQILAGDDLSDGQYEEVVRLVRGSSAVSSAERDAHDFADKARTELTVFAPSRERETLAGLCDYVVDRRR
jgi:heptaprenyl diphosphate synthase